MTTMLETLNETIAAYTSETRALDDDVECQYYTGGGRMCAVGRCMIDPQRFLNAGAVEDLPGASAFESKSIDKLLKPEYHGFSIAFWKALQRLHDVSTNWGEDGLSIDGVRCVNRIVKQFHLGECHDQPA